MAWMGSMFFGVVTARRRAAIRNISLNSIFLIFEKRIKIGLEISVYDKTQKKG